MGCSDSESQIEVFGTEKLAEIQQQVRNNVNSLELDYTAKWGKPCEEKVSCGKTTGVRDGGGYWERRNPTGGSKASLE